MQRQNFDREWYFHLGDLSEGRWREPDYSKWSRVDLPHDWSIEQKTDPAHPSGASGGFFPMGAGWYRKIFNVPEEWRGKKVFIEFEGVYMNAETWVNDDFIGRHPYGYTSFYYDLTPHLKFGAENTLKMLVDNSYQLNSRWYSGSGIYRHVWFTVSNPIHVSHWGVYVTTPEVSSDSAAVHISTFVENETELSQEVTIRSRVLAPDGSVAGVSEKRAVMAAGSKTEYGQDLKIAAPLLWTPDVPHLYRLETEVMVEDEIVDTAVTPFGVRSICFTAEKGFLLNGTPLKLKGGCVHHDNGVMGAASYDRSEERKVEILKANGYNAVRCAHNPPAPAFLDACDRLGMLAIDEAFDCWRDGKNLGDYHVSFDDWWKRDMDSMLLRDRNHPSVIMWSIGNEVFERDGRSGGAKIARMLAEHVRSTDPTRPVTAAVCGGNWPWERTDVVFAELDVCGYNYQYKQYGADHEREPGRIIYGSESTPGEAFDHWMNVLEMEHVIGDFVWTSLDYLGEAGIGREHFGGKDTDYLGEYPWHQAYCGDIDLCGFKRPQSYYRDILWQHDTKLYMTVHTPIPEGKTPTLTYWGWPDVVSSWTWPGQENKQLKVDIYSACEKVELFLNGKSVGIKPTTRQERFMATFEIPYEPGILKAVGYINNKAAEEFELKTVGAPAAIRLIPDRSVLKTEYGDLSYVTVEVVDKDGNVNPNADNNIFFSVKGEGVIAAVGSSNPVSTELYRGNQRKVYRGRCLVVVKSTGNQGQIHLRAHSDGLDAAEAFISVG